MLKSPMHGLCMPQRSWSVSLSTLFLCMLWLPTLELDRKIQKQSWQVVADLDTMEVLNNIFFSSFTNLMIIYWKRFGLWEQLLQHISLQCMAVKFITTIQWEICMHNVHCHSMLGLNYKNNYYSAWLCHNYCRHSNSFHHMQGTTVYFSDINLCHNAL